MGKGRRTGVAFGVMLAAVVAAGVAGGGEKPMTKPEGAFERIRASTPAKDGVKEITYAQFMEIRGSGEPYVLLDVLTDDSFREGHIEGAKSLPSDLITKETAGAILTKESRVVVYCGGFLCKASTAAAKKLEALGYAVLDYKGGLKEWKEKGHALAR